MYVQHLVTCLDPAVDCSDHNIITLQDMDDAGNLRYYTYGAPPFNYGFLPRTWEDPDDKISSKACENLYLQSTQQYGSFGGYPTECCMFDLTDH